MARLAGLTIEGFRSFAPDDRQVIGPLQKVHLLAGPNNSGKSNILRVAQRAIPAISRRRPMESEPVDAPAGQRSTFCVGVGIEPSDDITALLAAKTREGAIADLIVSLIERAGIYRSGVLWLEYEYDDAAGAIGQGWGLAARQAKRMTEVGVATGLRGHMEQASRVLTSTWSGHEYDDALRLLGVLAEIADLPRSLPRVETLDAFRRIGPGGAEDVYLNGPGLIERLARLQSPDYGDEADRERFDHINAFLATLFDDADTRMEIRYDHEEILVNHGGQRLPLGSYGTGVHQAVILAAAATVLSGHLICVEEPEVHLHPTLQRKLLRYLKEETDNQYLIATHSAHMLDSAYASISAVRLEDGWSKVESALEPTQIAAVAAELGLRASDLVQSNAILWVEGPSDRTYLKAWLAAVAPDLIEGIHFSIVFYGGALLRHLAADDPVVNEFVSLPRINRNFWVLIDSDRSSAEEPLNGTKERVIAELGDCPTAGCWVTGGYTIENYVPPELLREVADEVHPQATYEWDGKRFSNPLSGERFDGRTGAADKASITQRVADRWSEVLEWPHDLKEQVERVAVMIRRANDLAPN